jgi:hypothetical protein
MSSLSRFAAGAVALSLAGIVIPGGCSSGAGDAPDDGTGGTGASPGKDGDIIRLGDGQSDAPKNFEGDGCAAISKAVELTPVNLIFIVDKSGSMGAPGQSAAGDIDKRWNPMVNAFTTFFNSVKSPALKASFTFFPAPCDLDLAAGGGCVCSASEYNPTTVQANGASSVPLTQIVGNTKTFTDLLANNSPNGGTPTIAALQGSYTYAASVQAAAPSGVTYVVLITDGGPGFGVPTDGGVRGDPGCTGNDITTITSLTQGYAGRGIETYVFGMGGIANLDRIATAGGTSLVTISIGDSGDTTLQFINELNKIPKPVFDCSYPVPPTDGLDLNKVNVYYTNNQSTASQLIYNNPSCAQGDKSGWYMSGNNIELCQVTCNALKADASSALNVEFGCETIVINY